ncbi:Endo-xylogalacturonan hydrolase A [Cytospora mali]|uniref:Endo-xylogalacturonan hydrolase A n=1 Tax=Cytospora mali TaxID=578113 RepID=A0A194V2E6_CYTMA|nr:Endo-xylogalacturonan hydrolase A [Valsa mali var. pyri (nom. inval.)]
MKSSALLLAAGAAIAHASPSRVVPRASTCTPTAGGSSSTDDVPAIESAIAECASGTIVIPASTTYYVNSALSFAGCSGCTLQVEGLLKASDDTDYWNGKTAIFEAKDIDGLTVTSKTGSGVFDGNGQASYDLFAKDSSYARPTLFYVDGSSNVKISNLRFKNPPNVFHSSTGGSTNVAYTNVRMDATSKSSNPAKNTDGWDIGDSTYVTINGATVVNDDDCVAFKPGANYVEVYDISCNGSHGISVGSLGKTNTDTVENIYVSGATMINSAKASGIKLYPGGSSHGKGVVSNVTFENFVVDSSDYAFQVQSCYGEDTDYCDEYPSTGTIKDVIIKGYSGTTSSKYEPAVANIDCPADGTCDITMSDMTVKAPSGSAEYLCANTPSALGVTCTSGASG